MLENSNYSRNSNFKVKKSSASNSFLNEVKLLCRSRAAPSVSGTSCFLERIWRGTCLNVRLSKAPYFNILLCSQSLRLENLALNMNGWLNIIWLWIRSRSFQEFDKMPYNMPYWSPTKFIFVSFICVSIVCSHKTLSHGIEINKIRCKERYVI